MALMSVLTHGSSLNLPKPAPRCFSPSRRARALVLNHSRSGHKVFFCNRGTSTFRIRRFQSKDSRNYEAAKDTQGDLDIPSDEAVVNQKNEPTSTGSSFLLILAIALGVAAIFTIMSVGLKQSSTGSFFGVQFLAEGSPSPVMAASPIGFTFKAFGYRIILPEYAPGMANCRCVYFWLLMAAGCGLFISEEALNIWVGITLSRMLSLDGTWQSFAGSFSRNAPYIISTVLWVYWGVCISDMIPFYLGKLFKQSGASDDVCSKLGISEEKVLSITSVVQKYGNLAGVVERFSLGARNPTAFLAGTMGVSPECFLTGVCCGGLITLPLQLGIGFLLRERPMFALATVATVVGVWTVFPYVMAASTALFFYLKRRYST
ncbi:uncharacterized protein [Populus alba]|uniref:uncharacterized protein isoform X1 n=1 Tax=Populus alba TaxID=43335 RepID=UPI003CC73F6B